MGIDLYRLAIVLISELIEFSDFGVSNLAIFCLKYHEDPQSDNQKSCDYRFKNQRAQLKMAIIARLLNFINLVKALS